MSLRLPANSKINPPVFFGSAFLILVLVAYAAAFPEAAQSLFKGVQASIIDNAGWFYVLAVAISLIFCDLSRSVTSW